MRLIGLKRVGHGWGDQKIMPSNGRFAGGAIQDGSKICPYLKITKDADST